MCTECIRRKVKRHDVFFKLGPLPGSMCHPCSCWWPRSNKLYKLIYHKELLGAKMISNAHHSGLQLTDHRLRSPFSRVRIIFQGSLSLWRASVNLDVILVLHDDFNCVEISCFNPIMGFESSRIYVELHKVLGKLDFNAYNASIIAKEDEFRRKRRHFDKAIIERDTTFALVTKYLLSRLAVHREGSSLTQPYTIYLKPQLGDVLLASSVTCAIDGACPSGVMLDGLISKPDSLIPIVTNHYFQQTLVFFILSCYLNRN